MCRRRRPDNVPAHSPYIYKMLTCAVARYLHRQVFVEEHLAVLPLPVGGQQPNKRRKGGVHGADCQHVGRRYVGTGGSAGCNQTQSCFRRGSCGRWKRTFAGGTTINIQLCIEPSRLERGHNAHSRSVRHTCTCKPHITSPSSGP